MNFDGLGPSIGPLAANPSQQPASMGAAMSAPVAQIPPRTSHAGPVLVIEDESIIRQAIVAWLKSDGWLTTEAATDTDALRMAEQEPPAVVVCDVSLGSARSGVWVAGQLLARRNPPAIVYATSHDFLPVDITLREGVSAYLLKPFKKEALLQAVSTAENELLARRRRVSAAQDFRAAIATRRAYLQRIIGGMEDWERADPSLVMSRLNPWSLPVPDREQRVGPLAERVGARLGLTSLDRLCLWRATQLRNLGKLVMPESLLTSSSHLTSIEQQILRSYTTEGEELIALLGFAREAEWVGMMGKRWDGFDPRSVTPPVSEPSAGASALRVLQVFLSMTEDRSYRPAFSMLDAVEQLRVGAGTLYSPGAVNALIAVLADARI